MIARNRELYDYLQKLTDEPVPGFGGSFADKYPEDRDQILTQIFDYVRSTNLFDDTLEPPAHRPRLASPGDGLHPT